MLYVILGVFAFCFIIERVVPGWHLPSVRTWPMRVIAINIVQLSVVVLAGLSWGRWLSSRSLLRLSAYLNPFTGGFVAYFLATLIFFWWNLSRQGSGFL